MASKLAVATTIEGNISDEGLAAMSECRDITSLMARELAMGIERRSMILLLSTRRWPF